MNPYKYTSDPQRRSGRTVMLALNFVHIILDNPGEWIELEDHAPTLAADHNLFVLVCRVLNELGVSFEANKQMLRIKSHGPPQPYEYPEADVILEAERIAHMDSPRKKRNLTFYPVRIK